MTSRPEHDVYSLTRIVEMLGLSRGVITGLIHAGFVKPARGPRNAYQFSFRDIVLLRTAHQLRARQIPPRKLLRALRELRAKLPSDMPMSVLRISAVGNEVAVREEQDHWAAETGQKLFDFSVTPGPLAVTFIDRKPPEATPLSVGDGGNDGTGGNAGAQSARDAAWWLNRAEELEGTDSGAAERAYRQAIALAPGAADGYLNLGAMLCEIDECKRALLVLDQGLQHHPEVALLHFNRAVALEDLGREHEALAGYERCLALDPDLADAHYNVARLHEVRGNDREAVRHYSAYRRLQRR